MLDRYLFDSSADDRAFFFVSSGPRGSITKRVDFHAVHQTIHQLGLADLNEFGVHDPVVAMTNNDDVFRVMRTVTEIVIHFLQQHADQWVLFEGASSRHMRLYQRCLTKALVARQEEFVVYGIRQNQAYEPYSPVTKYQSILMAKRLTRT